MRTTKLFLTLAFVAGAVAQIATAQIIVTRTFSYPAVGLANTETMQVNVTNLVAAAVTGASSASATCAGTVSFFNAGGAMIGMATAFNAGPGATQSVPLTFTASGISGTRGEVRAEVVNTTPAGRNAAALCSLQSSLEVFDSMGVTHVYLSTGISQGSTSIGIATPGNGQ